MKAISSMLKFGKFFLTNYEVKFMKTFSAIISILFILWNANITSADIAQYDPFWKERQELDSNLTYSINDGNIISLSFKLPQDCEYDCKICQDPEKIRAEIHKIYMTGISREEYTRATASYYKRLNAYSEGNPEKEDTIKDFKGKYDGINNITETFKYESPEEGKSIRYILIVNYELTHKETPFGSKLMEKPETVRLFYSIRIIRENGIEHLKILNLKDERRRGVQ